MDKVPMKSHEIIQYGYKLIGMQRFAEIYGAKQPTIFRHARDPFIASSDPASPNHIDSLCNVAHEFDLHGRKDIAIQMLNLIASVIGCEVVEEGNKAIPDQPTMEKEMLDDLPEIVKLHKAIQDGQHVAVVRYLLGEAKDELNQTYEKYCKEWTENENR